MTEILIHRAPVPADRFMIVTNDFMRGELPVPLKALPRVLLGYFLSLPAGWRITRERVDSSVLEGRDAVSSALGDLETAGYLKRTRHRGQGGTWAWTYAVTDDPKARPLTPSPENPSMGPTSENATSQQVTPSPGSPSTVEPSIKTEDLSQKTDKNPAATASELPLNLPRREPKERQGESKAPTINQRANALAGQHYERLGKMGNVPAFLKIIRKALEHGYPDDQVDRACAHIAAHNWTLTEERLANTLRGGPRRPTSPPPTAPVVRTGPDGRGPILEGY